MQAVSFMYVRPPGYNAESAKAAEMNDEKKKEDMSKGLSADEGPSSSMYLLHHNFCISTITITKLICYCLLVFSSCVIEYVCLLLVS